MASITVVCRGIHTINGIKRIGVGDVVCIRWTDVFSNEDTTLAEAVRWANRIKQFRAYGQVMHIGENYIIIAHETAGRDEFKSNLETIPVRVIDDFEILKGGRPGSVLRTQSISSQRVRSPKKNKKRSQLPRPAEAVRARHGDG